MDFPQITIHWISYPKPYLKGDPRAKARAGVTFHNPNETNPKDKKVVPNPNDDLVFDR